MPSTSLKTQSTYLSTSISNSSFQSIRPSGRIFLVRTPNHQIKKLFHISFRAKKLIKGYRAKEAKSSLSLDDILEFHYRFEIVHPFQDGNGRLGRLIIFKECLRLGFVPFVIEDDHKMFYYRGLKEWKRQKGYFRDTCLSAQDKFKTYLDSFNIGY